MFEDRSVNKMISTGARGIAVAVAVSVGVAACGGGAGKAASNVVGVARMAAQRVTSGTPSMPVVTTVPTPPPAAAPAAPPLGAKATAAPTTAPNASSGAARAGTAKTPAAPVPAPAAAAAPATASGAAAVSGAALAPRRQPTAAEINQAIQAVHKLVPVFTPTSAQVARVGNQVCTAFDQGMTFSQVKSKVSALLGSWSWLLPSSTAADGVRAVVTLYCPGYLSKVA
jgi:hypothetical protein